MEIYEFPKQFYVSILIKTVPINICKKNVLHEREHGFRIRRSTDSIGFEHLENFHKELDDEMIVLDLYLDLSKES